MRVRHQALFFVPLIVGIISSSCAILPTKPYRTGVVIRMGSRKSGVELASAPDLPDQPLQQHPEAPQIAGMQESPPEVSAPSPTEGSAYSEEGKASWYHRKFTWRRTASSERYSPKEYTAAHRSLPFGTVVEVTNLNNKKTCTVKINDRGPRVKGRIIDLSEIAASDLGIIKQGVAPVRIRVIQEPESPVDKAK